VPVAAAAVAIVWRGLLRSAATATGSAGGTAWPWPCRARPPRRLPRPSEFDRAITIPPPAPRPPPPSHKFIHHRSSISSIIRHPIHHSSSIPSTPHIPSPPHTHRDPAPFRPPMPSSQSIFGSSNRAKHHTTRQDVRRASLHRRVPATPAPGLDPPRPHRLTRRTRFVRTHPPDSASR
jgi:hypothetical protein